MMSLLWRSCVDTYTEERFFSDPFGFTITNTPSIAHTQIPVVLYHGTSSEREDLRRSMFADTRAGRYSSRPKKKAKAKTPEEEEPFQPVVVTSYEICMRDQRFLENRSWKFLVVDEGHRIKNLNCKLIR